MKNSYITVRNLEDKVHPAKPKNRWKQWSTYPCHQVAQRTILDPQYGACFRSPFWRQKCL